MAQPDRDPQPPIEQAESSRDPVLVVDASLQAVLDAQTDYVLMIDERHRILAANGALAAATGQPLAELLGRPCPEAVHGVEGEFAGCPLADALASGRPELRLVHDERSGRWLESRIFPTRLRTAEGLAVLFHTARDVTTERETSIGLHRAGERHRVIGTLLHESLEEGSAEGVLARALDLLLSVSELALEHRGAAFLVEGNPPKLVMKVQRNLSADVQRACAEVPAGHCLCGRALAAGELQFARHLDERHEVHYDGMEDHGHYCLPVKIGDRVLALLTLYLAARHEQREEDAAFLQAVANSLAGVLERRRIAEERRQLADDLAATVERTRLALSGTVEVLAHAIEMRDPYTAGHQRRVADLARAIGARQGLSGERLEGLHMAGVIHDLGKIAVPAEILSKPSRLTEAEFGIIKAHPRVAYDILSPIRFPWPLAEVAVQHHERIDGSGYPAGLRGEQMVLEARIVAVADVVEAIASHRPYRPALGLDAALAEIRKLRGKAFDPEVVDACLEVFAGGFTWNVPGTK